MKVSIQKDQPYWSYCIVSGCTNRCCKALNSPKCYPHTLLGDSMDPEFFTRLAEQELLDEVKEDK